MKKFLSLLLTVAFMIMCFSACGEKINSQSSYSENLSDIDTEVGYGESIAKGSYSDIHWELFLNYEDHAEVMTLILSGKGDTKWASDDWIANSNKDPKDAPWISFVDSTDMIVSKDEILKSIKNVVIKDGVECIGSYTFLELNNLEYVEMPLSITSIGNHAFFFCKSISKIEIPQNITSIGDYAFSYCLDLHSVYFLGSEEEWKAISLGEECGLEDVNVYYETTIVEADTQSALETPGHVEETTELIDSGYCGADENGENVKWALYESGKLYLSGTGNMNDYNYNNHISYNYYRVNTPYGNYAKQITEVIIESTVTSIGDYAFYEFENLVKIEIPNNIQSIGDSAFSMCISLQKIKIPNGITFINDSTFSNCYNLKYVELSENTKKIGKYAFHNCESLTDFELPISVTDIDEYVFQDCDNITNVYFPGTEGQWKKVKIGYGNDFFTSATLHYNSHLEDSSD